MVPDTVTEIVHDVLVASEPPLSCTVNPVCVLVCPVEKCISLVHKTEGVDPRTGLPYDQPPRDWTKHPNNPAFGKAAAE